MPRLKRPYIPYTVREKVILRQLAETGIKPDWLVEDLPVKQRVDRYIRQLFGNVRPELHHRPALVNRQIVKAKVSDNSKHWTIFIDDDWNIMRYEPDANDPRYLVYLAPDDHDIETRVRGLHGQYSDLALARKRKRKERKAKRPKRKWPSRPFPKQRKFK